MMIKSIKESFVDCRNKFGPSIQPNFKFNKIRTLKNLVITWSNKQTDPRVSESIGKDIIETTIIHIPSITHEYYYRTIIVLYKNLGNANKFGFSRALKSQNEDHSL